MVVIFLSDLNGRRVASLYTLRFTSSGLPRAAISFSRLIMCKLSWPEATLRTRCYFRDMYRDIEAVRPEMLT